MEYEKDETKGYICHQCDRVYYPKWEIEPATYHVESYKGKVPAPFGWKAELGSTGYTITYNFKDRNTTSSIIIMIVWTGIFLALTGYMITSQSWAMLFCTIPFFLSVVLMFYMMLISAFNTNIIHIDQQALTTNQGPVPWFGKKTIAVGDIAAVYAQGKQNQAMDNATDDPDYHYDVFLKRKDGKEEALESDVPMERAIFLIQQIRKGLGK
jgi:hypothetical protein